MINLKNNSKNSFISNNYLLYFTNYLSLWIGNLGVVPLFSLAFFLFLPLALVLFFLILFVFNVLEPILITFVKLLNLKQYFLTFLIYIVKIIFTTHLGSAQATTDKPLKLHNFFLSIGEQKEIKTTSNMRYSVGNKAVLSSKYFPRDSKILIKAKSIGFSDLVIWQGSQKIKYQVYVVSKKEQMQTYRIASALRAMGLQVSPHDEVLYVSGEIKSLKDLLIFNKLKLNQNLIIDIKLKKDIKRKVLEDIYLQLNHKVIRLNCNFKTSYPICKYEELEDIESIIQELSHKYGVEFIPASKFSHLSNYKIKIEIIKVEHNSNLQSSLGAQRLEGITKDLFENTKNLYENNSVIFEDDDIAIKIISKPTIIMSLNEEASVELGSELAIQSSNQFGTQTNWKFAGLKIKVKLTQIQGRLSLNINSILTAPSGLGIAGKKVNQKFFIAPNLHKKFFEITQKQDIQNKKSLPLLNQIPLLKELFTHNDRTKNNVKILGFITLEEDKYAPLN